MDEKLINLQIGALLHDIGKIVRRAGKGGKNRHSKAGSDYLENRELLDKEKYREVYEMINWMTVLWHILFMRLIILLLE